MVEVAPTYFSGVEAAQRIRKLNPRAQIVCTLRDPVRRAYSQYLHMRAYGATAAPLRDAVREHPQILDSSRYARHIRRLRAEFGAEHVHVLFLEELAGDSQLYTRHLCAIAGLPHMEPAADIKNSRVNATGEPRHPRLARLGFMLRRPLRRARLYRLIEWARKLGLHQLFFGVSQVPGGAGLPTKEQDLEFLHSVLDPEVDALEQLLGREIVAWRPAQSAAA